MNDCTCVFGNGGDNVKAGIKWKTETDDRIKQLERRFEKMETSIVDSLKEVKASQKEISKKQDISDKKLIYAAGALSVLIGAPAIIWTLIKLFGNG